MQSLVWRQGWNHHLARGGGGFGGPAQKIKINFYPPQN